MNVKIQLNSGGSKREVYIYGAKTIAQRACLYLERHGVTIKAFLVSARYENPETLMEHPVWRIEEHAKDTLDVVIVAVSKPKVVRAVVKELQQYAIQKIITMLPDVYDTFPLQDIMTDRMKIATPELIAEGTEIFADETSEIIIEEGVDISSGVVILASGHSRIRVGKGTFVGKKTYVITDNSSALEVGEDCFLSDECFVNSRNNSKTFLGNQVLLGNRTELYNNKFSHVHLGGRVQVGNGTLLGADGYGNICFGDGTSTETNGYFAANRDEIRLGKDNMLSHYIKIQAGGHELLDTETGKSIMNRAPICTADHVWIGMGAALLPGADIGEGSVVGASSVVTKSFPSHCTIAGNPAHVLREGISWRRDVIHW